MCVQSCLFPPSPTGVLPDTQGGITVQLRVSLQHEAPAIFPKYHYTSSTTLVIWNTCIETIARNLVLKAVTVG